MKYNKGEWSEAYAFVKLLGEGKVYAADSELNKNEDEYYPVLKIIRDKIEKHYVRSQQEQIVNITDLSGNIIKSLSSKEFIKVADDVLDDIKNKNGSSFEVPDLENFLKGLDNISFKAPSKEKSDFTMEIYDYRIQQSKIHTFSVKSYLGDNPTLLNASQATRFIYNISNISENEVKELNKIEGRKKLKARFGKIVEKIDDKSYVVTFEKIESDIFESNLRLIDSNLKYIVAELLMKFYSTENNSNIKKLTEQIIEKNPLNIPDVDKKLFYKTKVTELIKAATLGMVPNRKWNKEYDVTGGILSVKKNGEVLCYHMFYSRDSLDEYLYENTYLETPSTSRHKFGEIYYEDGKHYFKLNLQIRIKQP